MHPLLRQLFSLWLASTLLAAPLLAFADGSGTDPQSQCQTMHEATGGAMTALYGSCDHCVDQGQHDCQQHDCGQKCNTPCHSSPLGGIPSVHFLHPFAADSFLPAIEAGRLTRSEPPPLRPPLLQV
ncbi:hypothetical protein QVG61_07045 [Thiohalobacter sp. IOR34]|uniref:hypothetical protein n=1 Tax=Thiohalobacter sp. IOR34 TaxID=3057176 RepID=UPI0025AF4FE6|nr:hypothetical protein [Thiohalobacter sp. IOR34]WJW74281.1 hypothetical protein QVG61_07045 [Thiohalobacter sp. IOR34]